MIYLYIDLTNEEIDQFQLTYYIRYLNIQNDENVWKSSKIIMDIIEFYQWYCKPYYINYLIYRGINYFYL